MKPFLETLHELLGEERLEHFTAQLAELAQEVSVQRKKGSMTLSINLIPNGDTTFKVSADLKTKVPNPSFGERIVYHTVDGTILRDNPNQGKFDLKAVGDDAALAAAE